MCHCKRTPCIHSFQSFVSKSVRAKPPTDDATLLKKLEKGWSSGERPRVAAPPQDDAALLASLENGWGDPDATPAGPVADMRPTVVDGLRPAAQTASEYPIDIAVDESLLPKASASDPDEDRLPSLSDHDALRILLESPFASGQEAADATPSTDGGVPHPVTIELVSDLDEETPFLLCLRKDLRLRPGRTPEITLPKGDRF